EVDRAGAGDVAVLAIAVVARGAAVVEVADEVAVDPDRSMIAIGDDGLLEPFVVGGYDLAGFLIAVVAAGAEVVGLLAVVVFPVVADLRFVALPIDARGAAEEYAAVELGAVGNDIELEREVFVDARGFDLAAA